MDAVEVRTIAKVSKRLVPFLIVCYFVAYLDRVNVGFAALTMNQDLGLSQTAFGFGAGIFFVAYFIFEVPSNLLLERFGARRWIARTMCCGCVVCTPRGTTIGCRTSSGCGGRGRPSGSTTDSSRTCACFSPNRRRSRTSSICRRAAIG